MFSELPESTQPLIASYNSIRRAIGMSGLLLPVVLGPIGWLVFGIEVKDNMSSYYHTPLRDVFVGTLCAMGVFLFCYRGHDWVENWTANLGCVFAIGVALLPLDSGSDPLVQQSVAGYLHTFCGGAFFLTLAFYSLHHFPSSRSMDVEQQPHEKQRDLVYRTSGITILLSMMASGAYLFLLSPTWKEYCNRFNLLFWLEWIALWAFAAAWLTKGRIIIADVAIDLLALVQEKLHTSGEDASARSSDATNPGRWPRIAAWLLCAVGGLAVLLTLLPLVPTGWWVVRCWDFPRLQLALMLTLVLGGLVTLRSSLSKTTLIIAAMLTAAASLYQWSHVALFTPVWPREIAAAEVDERRANVNANLLAVLTVNVKFESSSHDRVAAQIAELDPDILVLVEIDEAWRAGLASLASRYDHRHDVVASDGLGLCLWTKLPQTSAETRYLVEDRRPSIWAQVRSGSQSINVVAVHPTPPGLQDSTGSDRRDSRVRDAELVLIADEIAGRDDAHWIVAGDFNDVAWSHTTRLFKRLSGLRDPRVGRSFMGTFHAKYPLLRFPIDHIFLSDGFRVRDIDRHTIAGSDHFAMSADIVLTDTSAGTTPESENDDYDEASKIVEEGQQDAAERGVGSNDEDAAHAPPD